MTAHPLPAVHRLPLEAPNLHLRTSFRCGSGQPRRLSTPVRSEQVSTQAATVNLSHSHDRLSLLGTSSNRDVPLEGNAVESSPILKVHSPDELRSHVNQHPEKLSVLMCKARSCRPCKAFTRRYQRLAEKHTECDFLSMYGDETPATRKLMMDMEVKVTPTFMLYRGGQRVHSLCGINEDNLKSAIQEYS